MGILSDRQIRGEVTIDPIAENLRRPGVISYGLSSYGYDCRLGYKFKVFKPYPCTVIDPKNFDPRMLEEVDITPPGHKWADDGFCTVCGLTQFKGPDEATNKDRCPIALTLPNFITIPPHSFVLGESLERFWIPRDVLCVVVGKSTYARCGLIVNVTPGEPEWGGKWTIEISNTTPLPAKVYAGEGIMQCLFFRSDEKRAETFRVLAKSGLISTHWLDHLAEASCETSYKDKSGKYQHQTGVTNPKVEGDK